MEQSQIFFFTGEDDYRLRQELRRWTTEFQAKHGEENFLRFQGKDLPLTELLDAVATAPFIAERRLVIVEGLPKFEKQDVIQLTNVMHSQTILVFADAKPDKRLSVTKELQKVATVKEFKPFTPKELHAWIAECAAAHGAKINAQASQTLVDFVGTNPWMLSSEIAKLALGVSNGEISKEHIATLCLPSGERIIWGMTNLLGEKRIHDAIRFFNEQLERGEEPYGMWSILLDMTKKLVLVWACMQSGMQDQGSIARELKVSPFVVRGVFPLARSLTREQVKYLTAFMANADVALKSGGYKYTVEHQEEVIALIERAMLACA